MMNLRILFKNTRKNLFKLNKSNPLFAIQKFSFCIKTEPKQQIYEEKEEEEIPMDPEVFKSDEQKISMQLLNCKSSQEVLQIYKQTDQKILGVEIQTLVFYFACSFKDDGIMKEKEEFTKIYQNIVKDVKYLDLTYFVSFVWSLGLFYSQTKYNENDASTKEVILAQIKDNYQMLSNTQASSLAFACFQIYNQQEDKQNLNIILELLCNVCLVNKHKISLEELINFMIIFQQTSFEQPTIVANFLDLILQKNSDLKVSDICKIICYLGYFKQFQDDIKYEEKDQEVYKSYLTLLQDYELSIEETCMLLVSQSRKQNVDKNLLNSFITSIQNNKWEINISDYVNIWLSLAKLQNQFTADQKSKIVEVLQQVLEQSKIFKIDDLLPYEIINIIVACSSLKLNDKQFIGSLIRNIFNKFEEIEKEDLINLARSFAIYVKQFESFFILIHDNCVKRIQSFDKSEIAILKQTFNKAKILFPNSELIDVTIF